MKRKSNSYHLDIQTHRKNPYGLLRNSYREEGKVKKETICRFTGLSLEQLRAMQAAIQGKTVMKEDFKITQSREYGASFACVTLMKALGLHTDMFSRPAEEWVRSCLAMIAGRLVYAGSKLSLSHCGSYSALWETCGIDGDIDVNIHCYEAMDRLLERQDAIQEKLAKRHLESGMLVLYDITSSYMEGEYKDSGIKSLCEKEVIQLSMFDEKNIVEVIDGNMRYCLCKNPDMTAKEAACRRALLKKTTDELDKIVASRRKSKYSKGIRAGKVVNKYKMGKFIIFEGEGESLAYSVDETKIEQEARLDGCYIIYTDVSPEDMTATEVVQSYKNLIQVEQAFRNMKTVQLEIRPIYHKTDDRIRCHVFICMLAYYVMWHMKQRLQPFFEADGAGANRKYTFGYIIECMKGIRKETVEVCNVKTSIISTPTDEQNHILHLLKVVI